VSSLINPAKVLNFLDVAGTWDPSLAITMAAAVAVTGMGYKLAFAHGKPILGEAFQLAGTSVIDARLLAGAALFGIGWGLVGYCPGPAIAALSLGSSSALTFVAAMLVGMALARQVTATPAGMPASRQNAKS
jgi:uncharacterized membrane protein YedE/YeeE